MPTFAPHDPSAFKNANARRAVRHLSCSPLFQLALHWSRPEPLAEPREAKGTRLISTPRLHHLRPLGVETPGADHRLQSVGPATEAQGRGVGVGLLALSLQVTPKTNTVLPNRKQCCVQKTAPDIREPQTQNASTVNGLCCFCVRTVNWARCWSARQMGKNDSANKNAPGQCKPSCPAAKQATKLHFPTCNWTIQVAEERSPRPEKG